MININKLQCAQSYGRTITCHFRPDLKLSTGCHFVRELCLRQRSLHIKHSTSNNNQHISIVCYTPISLPVLCVLIELPSNKIPLLNTNFDRRSFSYASAEAWNNLTKSRKLTFPHHI